MTTAVPLDPNPSVDLTPAGQIAKLRHGDPGERYYAAWWLGRMRIAEGIPALIEALADETDRTAQGGYPLRRNAARALGKLGSLAGIPPLKAALSCSDGQVVAAAAQALVEIAFANNLNRDPDEVEKLGSALLEGLRRVERGLQTEAQAALEAIVEALGQLQVAAALEPIRPYLEHTSIRLQCAAARACYRLTGDPAFAQRSAVGVESPQHPSAAGCPFGFGGQWLFAGSTSHCGGGGGGQPEAPRPQTVGGDQPRTSKDPRC
jgi:phycocyanobilin lyase alpha subunit